jgi:alpha-glucosidase
MYEVYPRSFADGNGDGEGDLPGLLERLQYLADLGVDGIWIAPWYPSPMADGGYDVSDFCDIHPMFGTLADADEVMQKARDLGLRVIIDLVPNHTSNQHPWFQAALGAEPGSSERDRYLFRDGKGKQGDEPPNNWISCFGGSGWERVIESDGRPGQWYLHTFAVEQPDLNWRSKEVLEPESAIGQ